MANHQTDRVQVVERDESKAKKPKRNSERLIEGGTWGGSEMKKAGEEGEERIGSHVTPSFHLLSASLLPFLSPSLQPRVACLVNVMLGLEPLMR